MAAKDFFENEFILKIIDDLKTAGIKMEEFSEAGDIPIFERWFKCFKLINGVEEEYLFYVLQKDKNDLYKFILHRANDGAPRPYIMVPIDLIHFTVIKYFPENLEKYLSWQWKTAKKTAKMFIKQYNEALNIENKK